MTLPCEHAVLDNIPAPLVHAVSGCAAYGSSAMIFCSLSSRSGPIRLACTVRCSSLIATRLYSIWREGGRRERERERGNGEGGEREGGRV